MMKSQTVKHGTVLQRIKRHRESYLLMLPYLLFFTVFTLAPVVVARWCSPMRIPARACSTGQAPPMKRSCANAKKWVWSKGGA